MDKSYTVDNKKYKVDEVKTLPEEQILRINGQTVKLSAIKSDDDSRFIELSMPGCSKDKAKQLLPVVYQILEARIKDGTASKLEQAALLQLHYNEAMRAEQRVNGLSGDNLMVHAVVSKKDLLSKNKLDMNLEKHFPWLKNKNSKEYKKLLEIQKERGLEYRSNGASYDNLAMGFKVQKELSISNLRSEETYDVNAEKFDLAYARRKSQSQVGPEKHSNLYSGNSQNDRG